LSASTKSVIQTFVKDINYLSGYSIVKTEGITNNDGTFSSTGTVISSRAGSQNSTGMSFLAVPESTDFSFYKQK